MPIVELNHVRKVYDTKVAVEDLCISIEPGTMFGLLGPNGSGKTSSIRMMIGITAPDSGVVSLFGKPFVRSMLARVGYLPEERGLYKKMNVLEQLVFLGRLHYISASIAKTRAQAWAERLQISEALPKKTEDLSKGMQQKIQFIAALLHDPELIIMDEPFSGLDPVNASLLMDTLVELRQQGKTILFSTHRMDQVEKMCDNLALIHGGKLVLSGSMAEIKSRYPRNRVHIAFEGDDSFLQSESVESVRRFPGMADIVMRPSSTPVDDAQRLLADALRHARVTRFEVTEPTLEEIFIEKVREASPRQQLEIFAAAEEEEIEGATRMLNLRQASMRNVWIIAHREYMERIRTRGFMITTVMIPMIIAMFAFGTTFLAAHANHHVRIGVVSPDTSFVSELQREVERQQQAATADDTVAPEGIHAKSAKPQDVELVPIAPAAKDRLESRLQSGELDGYLIVAADEAASRGAVTFTPRTSGMRPVKGLLASSLEKLQERRVLQQRGINALEADSLVEPVVLKTSERPQQQDTESAEVCVSVLFFVMYLVIMLYGMNVARSIIEEKTSRIFEVMMATIRPEALMAGKIIGVGSVGLTQVGIWLGMLLLGAASSVAIHLGGSTLHISLTGAQIAFFFVYFALGYLLYSSIAAALGAITNSEQELQQMNMFLVLPLLSCFVLLGTLLATPDNTLARVLALVPLFTPLLMYFRVSLGHPAVWEVVLSLVLTSAAIVGIIWVTSRIYRVGVLMYGKRPNFAEVRRWLKYS